MLSTLSRFGTIHRRIEQNQEVLDVHCRRKSFDRYHNFRIPTQVTSSTKWRQQYNFFSTFGSILIKAKVEYGARTSFDFWWTTLEIWLIVSGTKANPFPNFYDSRSTSFWQIPVLQKDRKKTHSKHIITSSLCDVNRTQEPNKRGPASTKHTNTPRLSLNSFKFVVRPLQNRHQCSMQSKSTHRLYTAIYRITSHDKNVFRAGRKWSASVSIRCVCSVHHVPLPAPDLKCGDPVGYKSKTGILALGTSFLLQFLLFSDALLWA